MAESGQQKLERLPTGVPGLDHVLGGGLLRAGVYIIQGAPGAGKTILANQICFGQARTGGSAVYITLLAESHSRMIQHLGPMTFFEEAALPKQVFYASAFHALESEGLKGLLDLLRREIRGHKASLLVVDGFLAVEDVNPSTSALKKFVNELQSAASMSNCTILLLTNASARKVCPEQTMVDGLIELEEQVMAPRAQSYLRVRKFRGSAFLRGHHAYEITSDGIQVFPRIEVAYASPSRKDEYRPEKIVTGISSLDQMLLGGIPRATTTALIGPTGSGKTTLALQFLAQASPSEPGLFFGFYEAPERLCAKAESIGIDLTALEADMAVEVIWQAQGENQLDDLGHQLLDGVQRRGVQRLCVDGLGGLIQSAISPERVHRFFSILANELRARGCTTVYTLEMEGIYGEGMTMPVQGISSLIENLIMLRRVERRSRMQRSISVLKLRDSDFDTAVREFSITSAGIVIQDPLEDTHE